MKPLSRQQKILILGDILELSAPPAAWMRGVWLDAPILWLFVVILGGFSALGLLALRLLFALVVAWK